VQVISLHRNRPLLIRAGAAWDGIMAHPLCRVAVGIVEGRIAFIHPSTGNEEWDRHYWYVVDCPDLALLPGLVDCHVHLALDGVNPPNPEGEPKQEQKVSQLLERLQCYITHGILALRDGGDRYGTGIMARNLAIQNRWDSPAVVATGTAIRRHGRYGSFLGPGVTGREDLPTAIWQAANNGVDQIKVIASGIVDLTRPNRVGSLQFDMAEMETIISLARQQSLPVMVHASGTDAVENCINAGADSLEHGYHITTGGLNKLAAGKTAWVPTLVPVAVQEGYPAVDPAVVADTCNHQMQSVGIAHALGARIAVGTDAGSRGVPHASYYLREMILLNRCGLPPQAVLRAATIEGARVLGLDNHLGTLTPGKVANLIGVAGEPWRDLASLQRIGLVCFLPPAYWQPVPARH